MNSSDELYSQALKGTIRQTNFAGALQSWRGKVRDGYLVSPDKRAIVVTDRISAFDFVLGTIPFKGQVLNQLAVWWFSQLTELGIPHHLLAVPDPNISLVKNVTPLPIEIIVRGYLTGTTKTSSWYAYQHLNRQICGLTMPEGMKKNEPFPSPIITPTTKPETGHDEALSREDILTQGLVEEKIYQQAESIALKMFAHGQKIATQRGLILVDTKYEMGLDQEGQLLVIDEVHTPDSSRYWQQESYEEKLSQGAEPISLDKEFVRRMIVEAGYDVNSEEDPSHYLTDEIRIQASKKYQQLFQIITGEPIAIQPGDSSTRVEKAWIELQQNS